MLLARLERTGRPALHDIYACFSAASPTPSPPRASKQDAWRPPTQGQVGEAWRHPQIPAEQPNAAGDTRRPPTEAQAGGAWHHPTSTPVRLVESSGRPGWLMASLGVLAVALVLAGGLAELAARRTSRRTRIGQAA